MKIILLLSTIALAFANDVPLFLWGPKQFFTPLRATTPEPISLNQFTSIYSNLLSNKQQPEAVVAFVFDEMSGPEMSRDCATYQGAANIHKKSACTFLKRSLTTAVSSFAAPHFHITPAEPVVSNALVELHTARVGTARIFAAELDASSASSSSLSGCDALLSSLNEESHVFSDKKTDLILVKLSSDDHHKCMERLVAKVASATKGNYIAMLSADASPVSTFSEVKQAAVEPALLATHFSTQAVSATTKYPGVTRMNASILWGLMIAFLLLFILYFGLSWTTSIETPPRFSTALLQAAKEY